MEIIDLTGKKGLVIGVANADSLAWSAARHFREAGADLLRRQGQALRNAGGATLEFGAFDCVWNAGDGGDDRPSCRGWRSVRRGRR